MCMNKIKVEKRRTRYWVVVINDRVVHEGITKRDCLRYVANEKRFQEALARRRLVTQV